MIRQALRRATGREWSVRVEQTTEAATSPPPGATPPRPEQRAKDLLQLPLFRKAAEVLGAQLVRVDDGFDPREGRDQAWSADPAPDEV